MTPKEKAKELYNKMDNVVGGGNYDAKQYALIAVNEIIEIFNDTNGSDYRLNYWKEVKQEIQKL